MLQITPLPMAVVAAAAAVLSMLPLSWRAGQDDAKRLANTAHFPGSPRFSGTWFGALDAEPFGLPPGVFLPALLTIHPDGTMLIYDAGDFGAPPINLVQSAQFGSWVRTGRWSMTATTLFFAGDPITRDTTQVKRVRLHLRIDSADSRHLVGISEIAERLDCPGGALPGFLNCPNPITAPDSAWMPEPGGAQAPFEAWRLRAY